MKTWCAMPRSTLAALFVMAVLSRMGHFQDAKHQFLECNAPRTRRHRHQTMIGHARHGIDFQYVGPTLGGNSKVDAGGSFLRDLAVVLCVADTGIGIDPADHERIFEKFQRAADPEVQGTTGNGIGLYTAREIARRHHGEISWFQLSRSATRALKQDITVDNVVYYNLRFENTGQVATASGGPKHHDTTPSSSAASPRRVWASLLIP